ncbi:NUC189-domain-containing protein [Dacryopinax primogenitus]|uniref:NUC189-domain-containing protein n=1 Tax=Dacryopinax primogenitus (strain DJM 731) TaxID=1858805 RepID=M5G4Z6_DACPD|nr:NUC189-domain-containing protein [Dacryopinax primogenitus]EJU00922.1 NUC189-domain-containing protein [Dacryopinax primogenitus]
MSTKKRTKSRPQASHHLSTSLTLSSPSPLLPPPSPANGGQHKSKQPRYSEFRTAVTSGTSAPEVADFDFPSLAAEEAEPTLGSLLPPSSNPTLPSQSQSQPLPIPIPSTSLARILAQSLHSSDTLLLESCLQHRKPAIVLQSVQRLPPALAVPLLDACVERLGRSRGKGAGGGAAGSERAAALVEWIRAVLVCHSAYLLTIPELVTRLSGLYSTLCARLSLQPRLLTLSGRLGVVLSQLERREVEPPLVLTPGKKRGKRYVEGESELEDVGEREVLEREEEGSVEDVELGGSEGDVDMDDDDEEEEEEEEDVLEDEEDDEDVDEEDDDDDEEVDETKKNGFLHDEDEDEDEQEDEDESE